jgi:hypothetical protein
MATYVRNPELTVTIGGSTMTDVLEARSQLGFNMKTATATITLRNMPTINPWDTVVISSGSVLGDMATRFTGYFLDYAPQLYEKTVTLSCKGLLARAELYRALTNVDMSSEAANLLIGLADWGHYDEVMVATILFICSLTPGWSPCGEDHPVAIEGTSRLLGTINGGKGFNWSKGSTAMSFIDELDQITGYRTFDTSSGTIVRQQIRTAPSTPNYTFTEGVDISSATISDSTSGASNKVMVTGWNGDKTDREYSASATSTALMIGGSQWYIPTEISSAMIENATESVVVTGSHYWSASYVHGLSCEFVANWQLAELNVRRQTITLETPRADLIEPGMTVLVIAPSRLGTATSGHAYWVQQVDTQYARDGKFSQVLTCLAPH